MINQSIDHALLDAMPCNALVLAAKKNQED